MDTKDSTYPGEESKCRILAQLVTSVELFLVELFIGQTHIKGAQTT